MCESWSEWSFSQSQPIRELGDTKRHVEQQHAELLQGQWLGLRGTGGGLGGGDGERLSELCVNVGKW